MIVYVIRRKSDNSIKCVLGRVPTVVQDEDYVTTKDIASLTVEEYDAFVQYMRYMNKIS